MRLIDADVLLKDVDRLIKQYEDMMKECEEDRRYRLYLDIEKEIMGMRDVEYLIEISSGILQNPLNTMEEGEGNEAD